MKDSTPMHKSSAAGQDTALALVREAGAFFARHAAFFDYSAQSRNAICRMIEERHVEIHGHPDAMGLEDPLLLQLRALRSRHAELDAVVKSFLAYMDMAPSAQTLDELTAALNAMMGLELEGRSAQARIACSAILRDYTSSRKVKPKELDFLVLPAVVQQFRHLHGRVRSIQERVFGRTEPVSGEQLLGLLISLGQANAELLAEMLSPSRDVVPSKDPQNLMQMNFRLDASVVQYFRHLHRRVRSIHERIPGRGEALSPERLLGLLISLGEANPELVAQMGAPALTAVPFCQDYSAGTLAVAAEG